MGYHKFRGDQLFDGYRFREKDEVLIMNEDGSFNNILRAADAGENIIHYPGIISPGFINCHCHLELSHMKGSIPQMTGLVQFIRQVIRTRQIGQEDIQLAIEAAEDEIINTGTVAVGDICNNSLTLPQKLKRRIHYHNFVETFGFLPSVAETRFREALDVYSEFVKNYSPATASSIVPHAPYSVSPELWEKIIQFPDNKLLTIHNQETLAEEQLFQNKKGEFLEFYSNLNIDISFFEASGKSSIQTYVSHFQPDQQVILVHNVYTSKEDLQYLKTAGKCRLYFCLCPNANLYITGRLPDLELLMSEGADIVLGTDSLASNQQLSILAEMQTIRRQFPSVNVETLFGWATLNGAKALQMDNILGSFEAGKKPGVVLSNSDLSASRRLL